MRSAPGQTYRPWIIPGKTPAFKVDFYEMHWRDVDVFVQEMTRRIPERISELERYIRNTRGFSQWQANFSRRSLEPIGLWLTRVLRTRPLTAEEKRPKLLKPLPKGITMSDLSGINATAGMPQIAFADDSRSVLVDVGLYFGETLRHKNPRWNWCRARARRTESGYNQPILAFGEDRRGGYEPFISPDSVAYRIVASAEPPNAFASLLDVYREDFE
jgi:hypothetical protein